MNQRFNKILAATCLVYIVIASAGCKTATPGQPIVHFAISAEFSGSGQETIPQKWWESFGDEQLNDLIEQGLSDNFGVRRAWDRLSQAEYIAARVGADLWPEVNYQADARRTRREDGSYTNRYLLGAAASYELDLWGRVRSTHQAASLDMRAAAEDVDTAAITISASIASIWYQLAEAKLQSELIQSQIEINRNVLKIVTMQFRQGLTGASDVFRQQQLVEATRGQLLLIQENAVLLQHQLSVLLGISPGRWWQREAIDLAALPDFPDTGLPSELLQRRPDIRSAEKTVQAADFRVAAAVANQYPRISLFASTQTSAERTNDIFVNWLSNLGANMVGPVFDGNFRRSEIGRTRAVLSETINRYAETVLFAFRETEDAINQELYQRQYIENLEQQLDLARQVHERSYQAYLKGQLDYLRVLDSLISTQNLERNLLTARRRLIQHRIELYRSLAGGWPMQRPEQASLEKTNGTDNERI